MGKITNLYIKTKHFLDSLVRLDLIESMNIETVLNSYIETALWSSLDSKEQPLDDNYGPEDLSAEAKESMRNDVKDFLDGNKDLLEESGLSDEQIGHNFWLSRNGHGAGFFDLGQESFWRDLQSAAEVYGSSDLYEGDDGNLYVS
jgi:hypothetical protein